MAYQNGDVVSAESINKAIDDSTTAVNTANTAKAASDKASTDVVELAKQIGTKQGTTVTVGGVAQNAVVFVSDPQTQINNLAPKDNPTLTNATLNGNTTIGNISNAEINALDGVVSNIQTQINELSFQKTWKRIYPVGYIYESTDSTSPASLFGGTWEEFGQGRTLVGRGGEFPTAGATGGAKSVRLTGDNNGNHSHMMGNSGGYQGTVEYSNFVGINATNKLYSPGSGYYTGSGMLLSSGSGTPHENMPPYIVVYRWRRTA